MDSRIIKLGALGDVINTLPLAVTLKRNAEVKIHWVVEPLSYPILKDHPSVDHVVLFEKKRWRESLIGIIQEIRSRTFDVVLDLQRILKSGLITQISKANRRIGFDRNRCKEMTWIFPFERIPPADPGAHMLYQYLEFAEFLNIPVGDIKWNLPVTGKLNFEFPGDYIVLNIGATKPANLWTSECFALVAKTVHEKFNLISIITGGVEDSAMAGRIISLGGNEMIDIVGKTSVKDLIEVLYGAKVVVSCDTGPMHLAVALDKNVIGLFGPSDPRRTGPFRGEVIQKNMHCSPCNQRKCDSRDCMKAITATDVVKRIESLLK